MIPSTYLQGILSREALIAVLAREGLYRQMNSLVSLQVVVPVEALRALVALEWPVIGRLLLMLRVTQEVWYRGCVSTVESLHHAGVDASN